MSGIRFGADSFSTYEEGIKKEWIVGNGLGGYASSTVIGAGTRTYHAFPLIFFFGKCFFLRKPQLRNSISKCIFV